MSDVDNTEDRHHAPEGRKNSAIQLILVSSLFFALCFIAYLLLFNKKNSEANATVTEIKKPTRQLHTSNSLFEMPVFKKPELPVPEPLPEPVVTVALEAEPEIKLDPVPEPEPIPMSEVLPKPELLPQTLATQARVEPQQVVKDKPMTDEERRLGGVVSGSKGIQAIASSQQADQTNLKVARNASYTRIHKDQTDDAFLSSVYSYKEGQEPAEISEASSELTSSDLERLDRLAALYGVSEGLSRGESQLKPTSQLNRYATAGFDSYRTRETKTRGSNNDTSQSYKPVNQGSTGRVSAQGRGIDLSSTRVVSAEAKRIKLDYLLKRGTYISCVLKTRIVSDQAGFISCSVTENIYSANGENLLLPRGSDVLGEYKPKSLSNGKVRLHAVWDAVTTPEGIRVNLASPSTGRLGASGIGGHINNHYGKKVGIPVLLSLFRTAIDYRTLSLSGESGAYQQTGTDAADDVLSDQIKQYEEIRPTLTKQQGSTIGIMVARDVSFENVLFGMR
jgi:type IV secretory pathway VirB10-like protein